MENEYLYGEKDIKGNSLKQLVSVYKSLKGINRILISDELFEEIYKDHEVFNDIFYDENPDIFTYPFQIRYYCEEKYYNKNEIGEKFPYKEKYTEEFDSLDKIFDFLSNKENLSHLIGIGKLEEKISPPEITNCMAEHKWIETMNEGQRKGNISSRPKSFLFRCGIYEYKNENGNNTTKVFNDIAGLFGISGKNKIKFCYFIKNPEEIKPEHAGVLVREASNLSKLGFKTKFKKPLENYLKKNKPPAMHPYQKPKRNYSFSGCL
ncbi:MAG: hypothetical protein ABH956_02990 [Candidatus Nealsonbacteria bacterium]